MPKRIVVLLTWTTHNRDGVIDKPVSRFLEELLPRAAQLRGALIHAVGIVSDHVHLVVDLPLVVDVPRLVQGLKGASARMANGDKIASKAKLKWASGYDVRSVSLNSVQRVIHYVTHQEERHPLSSCRPAPQEQ